MCRVTRELPAPIQMPLAMAMPSASSTPFVSPSSTPNVMVKTAENRMESKQVVVGRTSNVYEMGPILREGKFGSIRVASALKQSGGDFERQENERPVALKVYSLDKMKDMHGNAVENPWLEIEIQQLIGQTKSPHLVGVIETCIIDQYLYIVLPYFTGGDVLDVIETRFMGALPVMQAKKMFQHVMKGLQTLHGLGIAHRDLSIENILYDDATDTFAICDYGMALRVPRDPATGRFLPLLNAPTCGKEGYIAPELWKQEPAVDVFACDMWSAGVVLFMALTGSAPMQRAHECDPYYQMISQKRLFEMLGDDYEMDLETYGGLDLVQMILEPNPANRPTAADVLTHSWVQM